MHMILLHMYLYFFRLEEVLCNLQVLTLKNASLSLTCNENRNIFE